ncbi:hypothetical protein [Ferrimicrobium acidiphilum]|uniref:hypothetical protein n=1 Tax=Ferrimicrobium acidiphilum TaxID=121039 RepID=UPI000696DCB8
MVNSPTDLGAQRHLRNLAELIDKARQANHRLLDIQRTGQGCGIETVLFGNGSHGPRYRRAEER